MIPTKENDSNIYHHFYNLNSNFIDCRLNNNMSTVSPQLFSPHHSIEINNSKHEDDETHQFMNVLPAYSFESKESTNNNENTMTEQFYDLNSAQENLESSPIVYPHVVTSIKLVFIFS
jgi:hypothetical protein